MTKSTIARLIHAARIQPLGHRVSYLLLRESSPGTYTWYIENGDGNETDTGVEASNIPECLHLAFRKWRDENFRPLHCGFRYDMEPRDEHGVNALFCEMVESYSVVNVDGQFFDEFSGHRCYVDFASDEALDLWHRLASEDRL